MKRLSDMVRDYRIVRTAAMALAHAMRPDNDQNAKTEDVDTIRQCFTLIADTPNNHRRVVDIAERYSRKVEEGIETASERHEIENMLRKMLDHRGQ